MLLWHTHFTTFIIIFINQTPGFSKDPEEYTIQVGEIVKDKAPVSYEVEELKLHEKYKPIPHLYNDIAIMRIKESFPDDVIPVCLPALDTIQDGDKATILGWGDLSQGIELY